MCLIKYLRLLIFVRDLFGLLAKFTKLNTARNNHLILRRLRFVKLNTREMDDNANIFESQHLILAKMSTVSKSRNRVATKVALPPLKGHVVILYPI